MENGGSVGKKDSLINYRSISAEQDRGRELYVTTETGLVCEFTMAGGKL